MTPQATTFQAQAAEIFADNTRNKVRRLLVFLVLFALVAWSVYVTIVADTDWERIGSLGAVLTSVGRFVSIDFALIPLLYLVRAGITRLLEQGTEPKARDTGSGEALPVEQ